MAFIRCWGAILLSSCFVEFPSSLSTTLFSSHDRHEAKGKRRSLDAGEVFEVAERGSIRLEEFVMRE